MRRSILPIVFVLGALAFLAVHPFTGRSNVGQAAGVTPVQGFALPDCPYPSVHRHGSTEYPCACPANVPSCGSYDCTAGGGLDPVEGDGCLSNCDLPMVQVQETRPEPPATAYYERTDRKGSATMYEITRQQTRLAAYKLGLRGPACTAQRDSVLGY